MWGERIGRGEGAVEELLDVATALGLASEEGSGLLEVPDFTNARGLREAGCLPDAGPGLHACCIDDVRGLECSTRGQEHRGDPRRAGVR